MERDGARRSSRERAAVRLSENCTCSRSSDVAACCCPLRSSLDGHRKRRRARVAARVCGGTSHVRVAYSEPATRVRRARHRNDAVNVVVRRDGIGNAGALRAATCDADALVIRAADGRRGQVELEARDGERATPGIKTGKRGRAVRDGCDSAAARCSGVDPRTSGNRERLACRQRPGTDEAACAARTEGDLTLSGHDQMPCGRRQSNGIGPGWGGASCRRVLQDVVVGLFQRSEARDDCAAGSREALESAGGSPGRAGGGGVPNGHLDPKRERPSGDAIRLR